MLTPGLWHLPTDLQAEKATLVEVMERSLFFPAAHVCGCTGSLAAPIPLRLYFRPLLNNIHTFSLELPVEKTPGAVSFLPQSPTCAL